MLKKCVTLISIMTIIMSVYYYYHNMKYSNYRNELRSYIKDKVTVSPLPKTFLDRNKYFFLPNRRW